jgi:hypothetical protein
MALLKPWTAQRAESSSIDTDPNARAILRLGFGPTKQAFRWPQFEILATSSASREGERAPLNIARISAIGKEKSCVVLCPDHQLDLGLTQRLKRDLWFAHAQESLPLKPLLNALREYFGRAQGKVAGEWVFAPFVSLPLHASLKFLHRDDRNRKPAQDKPDEHVEYILRTVEVIDVDSRELSSTDTASGGGTKSGSKRASDAKLCLEHITATGAYTTRQELRLGEQPLLCPPKLTQPNVRSLVETALQLVQRLGQDPTKAPLLVENVHPGAEPEVADAAPKAPKKPKDSGKQKTSKSRAWKKKN